MKKKTMRMLSAALAVTLLSGCGAAQTSTPAETSVNQAMLLEKSAQPQESAYTFPEKFTGDWTGQEGKLTIHADAQVVAELGTALPTATVEPREFTQEDVDNLLKVFLKGEPLYGYAQTKQECQDSIDYANSDQWHGDPDAPEQTPEELEKRRQSVIAYYTEKMKIAVQEIDKDTRDNNVAVLTEEIENALQSIANKYNANEILLNITGGEPLLRKDLFEVMKFAKNLGYHWGMTTNAMLINDDNIEKMKETGMTTISISLDGLENSHDEFRGVKGSFTKIIENIQKLKKADFLNYLQVTTVVNKLNIKELEEMYSKMKELQIDSWRIVNMDPIGRAQDNSELALEKEDYKYLLDFIKEKKKKSKFDVTYGCTHFVGMKYEREVRNHMFFCVTGFTTGSILYNGDIYVCPSVERRKELVQGNIRTDDFVDVWENKFKWFRNLDKLKCKECESCKDWKYCRGDSLDTWDFNNNRPKLCLSKMLEGDV